MVSSIRQNKQNQNPSRIGGEEAFFVNCGQTHTQTDRHRTPRDDISSSQAWRPDELKIKVVLWCPYILFLCSNLLKSDLDLENVTPRSCDLEKVIIITKECNCESLRTVSMLQAVELTMTYILTFQGHPRSTANIFKQQTETGSLITRIGKSC